MGTGKVEDVHLHCYLVVLKYVVFVGRYEGGDFDQFRKTEKQADE